MNFYHHYINLNFNNTKHTCHGYVENYYSPLFENFDKEKKYNILEIGVRDGSSLKMWNSWFNNSKIYGVDIHDCNILLPNVFFINGDAYTKKILDTFEDNFFDMIIDDGPHNVPSQIFTIKNYINKLKHGGNIIIEDIGCKDNNGNNFSPEESLNKLIESIDTNILEFKIFDLRNQGQYDSIILEITKK